MGRSLTLFLAVAALCVCVGARDFDLFLFVQGWPGTICKDLTTGCQNIQPPTNPQGGFLLHGLWPQYSDQGWPQFCDPTSKFSESEVSDSMPDMLQLWPSIMGSKVNDDFWSHEWSKHGTCAYSVYKNQHDFFAAAVAYRKQTDVLAMLAAKNIVPSDTQTYTRQAISDAISSVTGQEPAMHCSKNDLFEVWICVDKQLNPIACPQSVIVPEVCPDTISIPTDPFPLSSHASAQQTSGSVFASPLFATVLLVGVIALAAVAVALVFHSRSRSAAQPGLLMEEVAPL